MAGLLGMSWDDPRTMATLQLAQGLLGSPRLMQGAAQGLQGYGQAMAQAKQQQQAEQLRQLQMQQAQLQLQQQQREAQRQQQLQDLAPRFMRTPQQQAMVAEGRGPTQSALAASGSMPGGFDYAGYAQALAGVDPMAALQMQGALREKAPAPIKVGAGEALFDPVTQRSIFTNPKEAEQPSAVREYLFAKQQEGYPGSFTEWENSRRRAGAASTTVSLGSPVPVTLPDGSTALVQPSNRPGTAPQIMKIPGMDQPLRPQQSEKVREALRENAAGISKIDRAISALDAYPDALGAKNYLDVGGAVMQRFDQPGVEARALVADVGSAKIHDRSGAAVTAAEFPRLRPFVPLATDSAETARKKLLLFRREFEIVQQELNSGATLQQAATPRGFTLPSSEAIAAELARRGGR